MKQIQPVSIWYNGQIIQATLFNLICSNDNLSTTAIFYYELLDNNKLVLNYGNITMTGADYTNYSSNSNSNDFAYQWGATQLNLTLI